MYFTMSATTKQGKKLLKQTIKQSQKVSFIPKTLKYTAIEMEEQLHTIGRILEDDKQKEIQLVLTLHDAEGKIEKEGTDYVFGPLDYQISEGFYPTLIDVIKKDMLKETDETLSVEESFRNEKLISVLEEALEEGSKESQPVNTNELNNETAPWERPILKDELVEEREEAEAALEPSPLFEDFSLDLEEEAEAPELEVPEEPEPVETVKKEPTVYWTTREMQSFVEPFISEEIQENQTEIQRLSALEYINEQYPPEEAWMKEKNQLYINQLYTTYDLPQTYQAFLEGKQQLIAASKEQLIEQWEQAKEINWEETALESLTPTFEEREAETNQEINDYATEQSTKWEKTKEELEEEKKRVITEEIEKINKRYAQKEEQAFLLFKERINHFTEENQKTLSEEKKKLLVDQVNELKGNYFQDLQTEKIKIDHQLNEQLVQLYHATNEVITEKQEKIQQELMDKLPEWKQEHERQQKKAAAQQAQLKKEQKEQEVLETKRKEQALKEEELALEKQRLEQQRESEKAEREARKSQQEAQLEQLRQAQLNYFTSPTQVPMNKVAAVNTEDSSVSKKSNSINGWMVGCLVSVGLLIGGSSAFLFDHMQQSASAKENQTQIETEKVRKIYEEKLHELLTRESTNPMLVPTNETPTTTSKTTTEVSEVKETDRSAATKKESQTTTTSTKEVE